MNTKDQELRAIAFRGLHEREGIFVAPNPWDAGSAKMLASLGFEALATTSAGLAFSLGKPDGQGLLLLQETIKNVGDIAQAVSLPVSADLENGYGDDPQACAETILLAAKAGAVGGSIEDATGRAGDPIYTFDLSVQRIKAAVKAARSLPFHFTLTARAENFLHGRIDLADTLKRLVAYAEAGADVLFAPGLKTREEISAVVQAVAPRPVNVVMGLSDARFSVDELQALGVKRVSVGSSLARAAYSSFINGSEEIMKTGTFGFAGGARSYAKINTMLEGTR
ncbi:2-Methylisocitrate lyase, PEP mutase family [Chryseolinea serpens]|uniref:2-Methylisocitrate lyase, PEP mutase family n=1 Tax=Chryseolinea serpens TaxID=947013 RepID=A0A1M5RIL0_9BACT|nr:isocitrate lyase/phosphoenolpyruvate mutase family protein [Chryseolinea serpens]SHH26104.1 2-Methylisocitrate lyase, PEP mutase family [Chryseolinea serpens]